VLTIEEQKNRLNKLFITVIGRMRIEKDGWLIGYLLTAYQAAVAATLVRPQHLSKSNILWQKGFKLTADFRINQIGMTFCM
jgi:hypothetical protein